MGLDSWFESGCIEKKEVKESSECLEVVGCRALAEK